MTPAVSAIQDYVQVNEDYCVCSHSNFNELRSEMVIGYAKWALRTAMTPTQLAFKEKTD